MVRKTLSLGSVAMAGLLGLLLPSQAQAAASGGNSCTATGIFSSCSADCPAGETPNCSTGFFGTPVSCTCSGSASAISNSSVQVNRAHEIAYDGYIKLLSTLDSRESQEVTRAAVQMMNAARENNVSAYIEASTWHNESLGSLPDNELGQVTDYLRGSQP